MAIFAARYGDGRTAASRAVSVGLGADGLEIDAGDGSPLRLWPWASLETSVPLGKRTTDVLITFRPPPGPDGTGGAGTSAADAGEAGATLFLSDPELARQLALRAPHLTARSERWRYARPGLAVAAVAGMLALGIWLAGISPSRTIANWLPATVWRAAGESVLESLTRGQRTCTGAEGRKALDRLVGRLSAAPDVRATAFDVRVVDSPVLNAFALPGRRIVLTRRLITTATSAEELAGVVAHEMGHGLELHPEAGIVRVLGLSTLAKLVLSGGGDSIANIGVLLAQLSYSRDAEREADAHAVRILREARMPAAALASFFERMRREGRERSGVPGFDILSTHPSLDERIAAVKAAPVWPTEPAMDAEGFKALAAICAR